MSPHVKNLDFTFYSLSPLHSFHLTLPIVPRQNSPLETQVTNALTRVLPHVPLTLIHLTRPLTPPCSSFQRRTKLMPFLALFVQKLIDSHCSSSPLASSTLAHYSRQPLTNFQLRNSSGKP
ncbi:hypothetical protein PanWU01x14_017020 [Parasponia andersonii]|uniref:Uncharacterized protein n=1 Tax=Parasponia andersonii TaxID=3476 RepID=A0A2P5DZU1_PARAD|nr:hypothetical protein PanWU01x14_017020 [Parasponia andersonii]